MKFSQLGLTEPLVRATNALGYETATPIQRPKQFQRELSFVLL